MKKQIPNIITLCNLVCGTLAVIHAVSGDLRWAALFILLGAFLDFFDGLAARLLGVSNELGKQLDSLADLVSFGLAPCLIAFRIMTDATAIAGLGLNLSMALIYLTLLIVVLSAYRLAKFNIDTRQTENFIGMPTPANALFWLSIPLIMHYHADSTIAHYCTNPWIIAIFVVVLSVALVIELPVFSLKFKHLKWAGNEWKFVLIVISIVLLIALSIQAVPLIIIIYLLLSGLKHIANKSTIQ